MLLYPSIVKLKEKEFEATFGITKSTYRKILDLLYFYSQNNKDKNKQFKLSVIDSLILSINFIQKPFLLRDLLKNHKIRPKTGIKSIRLIFLYMQKNPYIANLKINDNHIETFINKISPLACDPESIEFFEKQMLFTHNQYLKMKIILLSTISWISDVTFVRNALAESRNSDLEKTSSDNRRREYTKISEINQKFESVGECCNYLSQDANSFFYNIGIAREQFGHILNILTANCKKRTRNQIGLAERLLMTLEYVLKFQSFNQIARKYKVSKTAVQNNIKYINEELQKISELNYPGIWHKGINEKEYQIRLQSFIHDVPVIAKIKGTTYLRQKGTTYIR